MKHIIYFVLGLLFLSGTAQAQWWRDREPPPCKPVLYCAFLGALVNDRDCWCYQERWSRPGPPPGWWHQRHRWRERHDFDRRRDWPRREERRYDERRR